jgi:hypothetical protein
VGDFEITKRLPMIQGNGSTVEFRAVHNGSKATGFVTLRNGHGKHVDVAMDAGQLDLMAERIKQLANTVRGLNDAKRIVVGLDKEQPRRNPWIKLPWPFGGEPPKEKAVAPAEPDEYRPEEDLRPPGEFDERREGFEGDGTRDADE